MTYYYNSLTESVELPPDCKAFVSDGRIVVSWGGIEAAPAPPAPAEEGSRRDGELTCSYCCINQLLSLKRNSSRD
jgi:hypothetical protein